MKYTNVLKGLVYLNLILNLTNEAFAFSSDCRGGVIRPTNLYTGSSLCNGCNSMVDFYVDKIDDKQIYVEMIGGKEGGLFNCEQAGDCIRAQGSMYFRYSRLKFLPNERLFVYETDGPSYLSSVRQFKKYIAPTNYDCRPGNRSTDRICICVDQGFTESSPTPESIKTEFERLFGQIRSQGR